MIYKGIEFSEPDFVEVQRNQHKTKIAIERGELKREPCEICGCKNVVAHHEVYSNYLKVRWLCRSHHHGLHSLFRTLNKRSYNTENTYLFYKTHTAKQ
jgi:hypothetical protein